MTTNFTLTHIANRDHDTVESCHIFGSESELAKSSHAWITDPPASTTDLSESKFAWLSNRSGVATAISNYGDREARRFQLILDICQMVDNLRRRTSPQESFSNAIETLVSSFPQSIEQFPLDFPKEKQLPAIELLTDEIIGQHGQEFGFWILVDSLIQAHQLPADNQPFGSATTAVLFHDQREGYGNGVVTWLTVDLFRDYPGPIIPDLFRFGLTDFSGLIETISDIWHASGLGQRYRARWRITERYPSENADDQSAFTQYDPAPYFLPNMSGKSLSAAALAAMWAAAGQYPLEPDESGAMTDFYPRMIDGPLKLNPSIAISAALDLPGNGTACHAATKLAPIANDSIGPKIDAVATYCQSQKREHSLFDSVIVLGDNATTARQALNKEQDLSKDHLGVRVIDDCQTMGDAMNWLLEQNLYFSAFANATAQQWQQRWSYSKNIDSQYLDADHQPIDESQSDWESKRINTGSLAFMRNPFEGAIETEPEQRPEQQSDSIPID